MSSESVEATSPSSDGGNVSAPAATPLEAHKIPNLTEPTTYSFRTNRLRFRLMDERAIEYTAFFLDRENVKRHLYHSEFGKDGTLEFFTPIVAQRSVYPRLDFVWSIYAQVEPPQGLEVKPHRLDGDASYVHIGNGGMTVEADMFLTNDIVDVGYQFDEHLWGKGLGTEACAALIQFGFEQMNVRKFKANCFKSNVGSWRVMEKCGMQREACIREKFKKGDEYYDNLEYGLLRREWAPTDIGFQYE